MALPWLRSESCRYCCKSPKILGDDFLERNEAKLCSPFNMAPRPLAKSPVSFSRGDEVPHIFIRESHQRARKILISSGKRLLQQNLPQAGCEQSQQTTQFAVGTRVTSRPPHRSVQAAFPHTAPTSGLDGKQIAVC